MASRVCACGLPTPSTTSRKVADTSSSRRAVRTMFLNRLDSSTEIIFAPGEACHFTARAGGFEFLADAFLRRRHLTRRQTIFLQRVIRGNHFHRAQRHDLALKHKTDVLTL